MYQKKQGGDKKNTEKHKHDNNLESNTWQFIFPQIWD